MTELVLAAPLAGWATRLAEVPDPAFAQGLVGDGVAIDPTSSELCAPCDGVVASVHRARHACTLRTDGGAEILLHIGIDTVELRGEGFELLVAAGQRVSTGEPLIRIDLDRVVRRARSLVTPVLLVGGDDLAVVERVVDREVGVGDPLLAIARRDARAAAVPPAAAAGFAERRARLVNPEGLHARPAAAFAHRARQHAGEVSVACGGRSANGKSISALMALDARVGDEIVIAAHGPHAERAASELAAAVAAGLGDEVAIRDDGRGGAVLAAGPRDAAASTGRHAGAPADHGMRDAATHPSAARPAGSSHVRGSATGGAGERAAAPTGLAAPAASGVRAAPEDAATGDAARTVASAARPYAPGTEIALAGVSAVGGLAIGRAVRLADRDAAHEVAREGAGVAVERERLAAALAEVRRDVEQVIAGAAARRDAAATDIFRAHLELLDDPELAAAAERHIAAGRSAAWAWRAALQAFAAVLRGLGNPRLAERTGDLEDLERRMIARLAGGAASRVPAELPDGAVVIADELLPSEIAAMPADRLAALCTARGGSTSHVAILAAGMAVPAVVALGDAVLRVPDGAPVIVDGDRGELRVFPAAPTRGAAQRAIAGRTARRGAAQARAHEPARTTDGVELAVHANLGAPGDAAAAVAAGAEGCGLLRTEFLFLDRHTAPSEDEQAAIYQQIADALRGRPLVIRVLDAGGDKPLAYLPEAREDNPALGVRGVRLALRHPQLLRTQLRAILRVEPAGACRILVPMVASPSDLRAVRAVLDEERRALGAAPVALGAMIEVPAAAVMAGALARDAEFLSIGTNDLAQYALAIDRGHRELAAELDGLHPGVLRLVASTAAGAHAHGRPVSVCGGAAADPCAVPILLGLGIRTLSVAPGRVAEIKAVIRALSAARCAELAAAALDLDSATAVRTRVANTWPELDAGQASWRGAQP